MIQTWVKTTLHRLVPHLAAFACFLAAASMLPNLYAAPKRRISAPPKQWQPQNRGLALDGPAPPAPWLQKLPSTAIQVTFVAPWCPSCKAHVGKILSQPGQPPPTAAASETEAKTETEAPGQAPAIAEAGAATSPSAAWRTVIVAVDQNEKELKKTWRKKSRRARMRKKRRKRNRKLQAANTPQNEPLWIADPHGMWARRYRVGRLPHTVWIDAQGILIAQTLGPAPASAQEAELEQKAGAQEQSGIDHSKPNSVFTISPCLATIDEGQGPRWNTALRYIEAQAQQELYHLRAQTYAELSDLLHQYACPLTVLGPLLSYKLQDTYRPISQLSRDGSNAYLGMLFAHKQRLGQTSGATSNAQTSWQEALRGQTVAMVDPASASGGAYALEQLAQAGWQAGEDFSIEWLGSHARVAEAVRQGRFALGACFDDCRSLAWPDVASQNADTTIVAYTRPIPGDVIAIRRDLPPKIAQRLIQAVQALARYPQRVEALTRGPVPITGIKPLSPTEGEAWLDELLDPSLLTTENFQAAD